LLDDGDEECFGVEPQIRNKNQKPVTNKGKEDLLFVPFTCHACTYENRGGDSCEMCSTPRTASSAFQQTQSSHSQSQSEVIELLDDEWACNTCTLLNNSSYLSCSACGQMRSVEKDEGCEIAKQIPLHVSQSQSSSIDAEDLHEFSSTLEVEAIEIEDLKPAAVDIFSFSISQNTDRIALHRDGQPLHVNFDLTQILTKECSNLLEETALLISLPGQKTAPALYKLEFDDAAVMQLINSIGSLSRTTDTGIMSKEIKLFVSRYMELREIEKKALKCSGLAVTASALKSTAATLVVSSVSGETERYTGGAKEKARLNMKNNCATKRDRDIIDGKACAWCGETLHLQSNDIVDATYCSFKCAEEGRIRRGGIYSSARIRSQVFSLEHGVCCLCKLDAHELYYRILSLHPAERLNALMNAKFKLPKSSTALNNLLQVRGLALRDGAVITWFLLTSCFNRIQRNVTFGKQIISLPLLKEEEAAV
jgi:hypothetical protein